MSTEKWERPLVNEIYNRGPLPEHIYYICGPMTGLPDHNFGAFMAAEAVLLHNGYKVVNPARLNPEKPERPIAFKRDFEALLKCNALILLPGFPQSNGAMKEIAVAAEFGYPMFLFTKEGLLCLTLPKQS